MQNQNESREVPLADLIGKVLALAWDPALPVSIIGASGLMCNTEWCAALTRKGEV